MEIFNDLLNFKIVDIIDVILVAVLLYYVYKLTKGTVAINIFIGIIIIYFVWKLTEFLEMELLTGIFGGFMKVGDYCPNCSLSARNKKVFINGGFNEL
ncbi:diadenylate cyclase spyDAC [Algibacter lectus]|uniref:Diadenylate cyclase spyDAC n=1 Tax=Algibacter lectus TaxID=221126 RepID=A0A090WQQ5_9FLAO|nr:diadenylate cyclase spyDAC [Algibacter lectus]